MPDKSKQVKITLILQQREDNIEFSETQRQEDFSMWPGTLRSHSNPLSSTHSVICGKIENKKVQLQTFHKI